MIKNQNIPEVQMSITKRTKNEPSNRSQEGFVTTSEYLSTLADLKRQIQENQIETLVCVNQKLIHLYWNIGKTISDKQKKGRWGTSVIEQLAKDLQNAFPRMEGFSRTNVFRMRAFYLAYEKVPQPVGQFYGLPVAQIPWGHNIVLLEKLKDAQERLWYAQKTIKHGWSRSTLLIWIENNLYQREG
ncbi:MAG: DUF1016 N-terminal domain-containing protein, partial [Parachlamydia sp.]|nr:DUF1016 N-terminal domain-containing protein [Parachlamydia sp.]